MAIALRPRQTDAPAVFGSRDEIAAVADRMRIMLPSARLQEWQLAPRYKADAERNLEESLYRAAQLCVFYRLIPGEDVHLIPFNNGWAVDMGIETWKKAADRYCSRHDITYHIHTVDMPAAELKARRGENWDPEDAGVIAYLWRSDKADVYRLFGAEQAMSKGYGVWAKKARWDKGKNVWQPDPIPAHRSKQDVARRRAMKMVLRAEFSLDSLLAANPAEAQGNLAALERRVRSAERERALPAESAWTVDEDGLYIVDATVAPKSRREAPARFAPADGATPAGDGQPPASGSGAFAEPMPAQRPAAPELDPEPEPAATPDYRALAERLTGNADKLAEWARGVHMNSDGPASVRQYNFLAGTLDGLTGVPGSHNHILGVMVGRAVDKSNPPGTRLAKLLLDYLLAECKAENGEKEPNPTYRQDVADSVISIWRAIA